MRVGRTEACLQGFVCARSRSELLNGGEWEVIGAWAGELMDLHKVDGWCGLICCLSDPLVVRVC